MKKFLIAVLCFFIVFSFSSLYASSENLINPAQDVSTEKKIWNVEIIRKEKPEALKVFILDVGQGDSIFIEFPYGETMLIDAGSWDSYGIPHIKKFLKDYFKKHKYKNKTIDVVIASHPDYDHIRGLRDIIGNYRVNWYIDNGQAAASDAYKSLMKTVRAFDRKNKMDYIAIEESNLEFEGSGFYAFNNIIHFKDSEVYILGSYKGEGKQDINNASIVIKIAYGNTSILLTGDSEGSNILNKDDYVKVNADEYEENRIYKRLKDKNRLNILDSDVLKVGHHGSHHSATEIYLSEVSPEISVISVGDYKISSHAKRFGHPRVETLERLEKYTSQEGDIETVKAYKNDFVNFKIHKAIYITAREHKLKRNSVETFGDIVILLDGNKASREN